MNKLIGGIFLIIGTCIGASMLALPITTATSGFFNAFLVILVAWLTMTYSSLLLAEVNSSMPVNSNLISMARTTLGKHGAAFTWIIYLILLYSLLSAYIAGGSELLVNLFLLLNIQLSPQIGAILFTLIFWIIVYNGIFLVDWINRGLMSGKLIAFLLLCSLLFPHIDTHKLEHFNFSNTYTTVMLIFCAFGYGIIIPSLREYFENDLKRLRMAILIGSLIPLTCYTLWIFVVQSTIFSSGENGLISISTAEHPVPLMVNSITNQINNSFVGLFIHSFASICILTAFLGVSLSLIDFLADGLKKEKAGWNKLFITCLAFVPPLIIVLFKPNIFVFSLKFAGIFCVSLLMLAPNLMAFSKRYIKRIPTDYEVIGGKPLLLINALASVGLIIFGFQYLL